MKFLTALLVLFLASVASAQTPKAPVVRRQAIVFTPTDTVSIVWDYLPENVAEVETFRAMVDNKAPITLGKPAPISTTTVLTYQAPIGSYPAGSHTALVLACAAGGVCTPSQQAQFTVEGDGTPPPIDPPVDPLPPAGDESPNGTAIPPALKIVSATNHTWSLNGTDIYRDNQSANNGKGSKLVYVNKTIYAFGTDTKWYQADETNPQVYWAQLAGEPPLPPPDPSVLTLTCPANIIAMSPTGQPFTVGYAAPVATGGTSPINVVSLPASGSAFPIGSTSVTATATDAANLTATCTFSILIAAPPPPVFDCVANPLKFITRVTFPSVATGSQLRWQTNRIAVVTFDPTGTRWTVKAVDKNGCTVTATR